jgi:RNA polymerase sigma-70 factor, ECF subfamily
MGFPPEMGTDYGFFLGFRRPDPISTLKYKLCKSAARLTEEMRMSYELDGIEALAPCTLLVLNDNSLVAAAQSGVHQAYVELCRRHREMVFRTVHRITKNLEDTEDVLQESWMRGFMHIRRFDGRSAFSTWLTRIAINAALMMLRKRRSAHEYSLDEQMELNHPRFPETKETAQNPEERILAREEQILVRRAIRRLPPRLRVVLELRQSREGSIEDIASLAGISVAATKSRLLRAKLALRRPLRQL